MILKFVDVIRRLKSDKMRDYLMASMVVLVILTIVVIIGMSVGPLNAIFNHRTKLVSRKITAGQIQHEQRTLNVEIANSPQQHTTVVTKLLEETHKADEPWVVRLQNDSIASIPPPSNTIVDRLVVIAQRVNNALKHAKSIKAIANLNVAEQEISKALKEFSIDYDRVVKRKVNDPKTVCPEEYRGAMYGFPLFYKGFATKNCGYTQPLSKTLTVVFIPDDRSLVFNYDGILQFFPDVSFIVGSRNVLEVRNKYKNIHHFTFTEKDTLGLILNKLVAKVSTKYVLIMRNVTELDEQMFVQRLIREIEELGFGVVGGATREPDGKWRIGCYQTAFKNYTLVYYEGYDESIRECLVCDMIEGPFVANATLLKEVRFDESMIDATVFPDFFMRLGQERSLVCPDSMFHVTEKPRIDNVLTWDKFARKWELYKLKYTPGFEIIFPCVPPYNCHKGGKFLIPPCCVAELAEMTKLASRVCEENKIICELNGGTLLSGVKMGHSCAWDIDGDIMFLLANTSVLGTLGAKFRTESRFTFKQAADRRQGNKAVYAEYDVLSKHWRVEIFGKENLTSESYTRLGRKQTHVYLHGAWLSTPLNPGLWVRNRYGIEVYRHANNWRHLGKKLSTEQYPTNAFLPCPNPGHQNCVDNYRMDGNLQFSDPIP